MKTQEGLFYQGSRLRLFDKDDSINIIVTYQDLQSSAKSLDTTLANFLGHEKATFSPWYLFFLSSDINLSG